MSLDFELSHVKLELSNPSFTVLFKLPVDVVQRTRLLLFQPSLDAVEVEGMIAGSPGDGALISTASFLVSLAVYADVHQVVSTNGALVLLAFPLPHCHGVPLFDDEFFFGA